MIVKMKFLSITGPRADIDRMTNRYLSKYEMQLENALTELKTVDNLMPFLEMNPYRDPLAKVTQFLGYMKDMTAEPSFDQSEDEILEMIRSINHDYMDLQQQKEELKRKRENIQTRMKVLEPFTSLDFDLHEIMQYKYIRTRFGKINVDYYHRLEKALLEDIDALFLEGSRDASYVYGVYFVSDADAGKVDSIMRSLHFEKVDLLEDFGGTPLEAYRSLDKEVQNLTDEIQAVKDKRQEMFRKNASRLLGARIQLERFSDNFDIRKFAARTETDEQEEYYILCGWMTEKDALAFQKDIQDDDKIFCLMEDQQAPAKKKPPTKLRNPKLFKPFEMYVKMYGLPAYNEMDPTWFVAITYSFIFGAMFGDVGQGLVLFLGGLFLYKTKKMDLAGIIGCAGVFSVFFGFMYGSFFGFEDVLKARWLKPMNAMMDVPLVGRLNAVFVIAIGFGMFIILICMVFNIINSIRNKDVERTWFDSNAVAGLVFYGSIVLTVGLFISGKKLPAAAVLTVMFAVPLILMFVKEPLTNLVEKKSQIFPEQKGMFFVQNFFELFEVLLSYLSNTLSFLRIGAFAVSHAAMMEVVLMLAGATEGGSPNWIVVILGNIFVCAMEGLIVGIQVLRLEYYEIFSRFYAGNGREFQPFMKKNSKII